MVMTKQFTFLFLLVTIAVFAICLSAALAHREANYTYDLTAIHNELGVIANDAAYKIHRQEVEVEGWIEEAYFEVSEARRATCAACDMAWNSINP